jgi:hyperosmotically inducible periplasmic protein
MNRMRFRARRGLLPRLILTVGLALAAGAWIDAQPVQVSQGERVLRVRRALERLPYYGVFDFLAYKVEEKGTVMLLGFAYHGDLKKDAEQAVKRTTGVDEVQNKVEQLPASQNDDRIRWATFYNIYTDDFLSRYAPGGAMAARYDAIQFARFPGMQPFGNYPIHIIVKGGRITLMGVVDNEADKTMAGFKAREVPQVFGVENELMISKK